MTTESRTGESFTNYLLEKPIRRYKLTFIDTSDDYIFRIAYANSIQGIKKTITHEMHECGLDGYDPLGNYAVYVYDEEFTAVRLNQLRFQQAPEITEERGLDYDVWFNEYLTEEERNGR